MFLPVKVVNWLWVLIMSSGVDTVLRLFYEEDEDSFCQSSDYLILTYHYFTSNVNKLIFSQEHSHVYFLTFSSNICTLNTGVGHLTLFVSEVKDFRRTSNLGAVNLVLSCFLRSRRTYFSILNTSVKA